jgi:hypothetical protein
MSSLLRLELLVIVVIFRSFPSQGNVVTVYIWHLGLSSNLMGPHTYLHCLYYPPLQCVSLISNNQQVKDRLFRRIFF